MRSRIGPRHSRLGQARVADGVGFEPTRPLRAYGISSAAPSTELGDPSWVNSANNGESPSSGGPALLLTCPCYCAGVDRATRPGSILPTTVSRLARAAPRFS